MSAQHQISKENNQNLVGQELDVLLESFDDSGHYFGRTQWDAPEIDNQVTVIASNPCADELGNIARVRITSAKPYDLVGKLANEH